MCNLYLEKNIYFKTKNGYKNLKYVKNSLHNYKNYDSNKIWDNIISR